MIPILVLLALAPAAMAAGPWQVADTDRAGQWTIYARTPGGAEVGLPVGSGDFNGDGWDDVILTPMYASSGPHRERDRSGEAVIILSSGSIGGTLDLAAVDLQALPSQLSVVFGADSLDYFGTQVTTADLDGDGYDDAIIGAQQGDGAENARPGSGEVAIIWGGPAIGGQVIDLHAPTADSVTMIYGVEPGDRLGAWVSAGDFDGDGVPDAILGADQGDGPDEARAHAGETYVVYGGNQLRLHTAVDLRVPPLPVTVVYGIDSEDHSGCTVRGVDLDADGAAELLIGAGMNRRSASVDGNGGASAHANTGGDGPDNSIDNAGEAYVVYGEKGARPAAIDLRAPPVSAVIIYGVDPSDAYGEELFGGDFNGDGHGDIAIGALTADGPQNQRTSAGDMALILGGPTLRGSVIDLANPPANVTFFYGALERNISGDTVMLVDVDQDHRADLVIGSPQDLRAEDRTFAGTVAVFFGTSDPLPPSIDLASPPVAFTPFMIEGEAPGDMLAYSMAYGDVDGDGVFDLVVNVMGGDGLNQLINGGDAHVLAGAEVSAAAGRALPTRTPTPTVSPTPTATAVWCVGDCDDDRSVRVNELVLAVNVALMALPRSACLAADANDDKRVEISELVAAVGVALHGCP